MNFITIKTYNTRAEAELEKSLLSQNGVNAIVSADDVGGARPNVGMGTGGVKLVVDENDAQKAMGFLQAGVVNKNIAEQPNVATQPTAQPQTAVLDIKPQSSKTKFFVIGGVIIALIFAGVFTAYFLSGKEIKEVVNIKLKDVGIQTIKTIDVKNANYGENITVFVDGKTEEEAIINIYDYEKGEIVDSIEVPNKKATPSNPLGFDGQVGFYMSVDPTQNRIAIVDPDVRDKISITNFADKVSHDVVVLEPAETGNNRKYWRITSLVWSPDGKKIAFKVEKSSGYCGLQMPMSAACVTKEWGRVVVLDLQSGDRKIVDLFKRGDEDTESQVVADWRDDTIYLFPANTDSFYDRYIRGTSGHYSACVHHGGSPYYGERKHPYYPPILTIDITDGTLSEYDFVNEFDPYILSVVDDSFGQLEFSCELDNNNVLVIALTRESGGVITTTLRRYYIIDKTTGESEIFYETNSKDMPQEFFADITPNGKTLLMRVRNVVEGFYVDNYSLLDVVSGEKREVDLAPKSILLSF